MNNKKWLGFVVAASIITAVLTRFAVNTYKSSQSEQVQNNPDTVGPCLRVNGITLKDPARVVEQQASVLSLSKYSVGEEKSSIEWENAARTIRISAIAGEVRDIRGTDLSVHGTVIGRIGSSPLLVFQEIARHVVSAKLSKDGVVVARFHCEHGRFLLLTRLDSPGHLDHYILCNDDPAMKF